MKILRIVVYPVLIAFIAVTFMPSMTRAEDNRMRTIFMDTFYGMAAGALIASAVSLTQDDPDWGGNVGAGAAIGGIAGAFFGVASEVRYVATVNGGRLHVGLPSIGVDADKKSGGQPVYMAGLFKYKF